MILTYFFHQTLNQCFSYTMSKENRIKKFGIWSTVTLRTEILVEIFDTLQQPFTTQRRLGNNCSENLASLLPRSELALPSGIVN